MRGYCKFVKIERKYKLSADEISSTKIEEIGKGNFGTVYRGSLVRENHTTQIAIKVSESMNLKNAMEVDSFFDEVNSILKDDYRKKRMATKKI